MPSRSLLFTFVSGIGYYVEVENFEDRPLLLRAFETFQKDYGPIQFYGINSNRVNLNGILSEPKVKKCLVLSTADGKYVVPSSIRRWSPVGDFFRNHLTAVVRPVRAVYKEKYVGANIKYVIEFLGEDNESEIVPIHPNDFRLKIFRNFNLTQESLESKNSLTAYIENQVTNGKLVCRSFAVHDVDAWKERVAEFYTGRTFEAQHYGLAKYYIVGRLFTLYSDWKLKRDNERRRIA